MWTEWAIEIQSIAQAGLAYGHDAFDLERYRRLRDIAAEMIAHKADISFEKAKELFCGETGYQTPKVDTRSAVFKDGKILLVRENDGRWALPGGWCDVNVSVGENAVKETLEEAGVTAIAERLIAVQDRNRHNEPPSAYGIVKIFVLCAAMGGEFAPNIETVQSGYFGGDELPGELAETKTTREQILMCFDAEEDKGWIVRFE